MCAQEVAQTTGVMLHLRRERTQQEVSREAKKRRVEEVSEAVSIMTIMVRKIKMKMKMPMHMKMLVMIMIPMLMLMIKMMRVVLGIQGQWWW